MPELTVVMPVYNEAESVAAAIAEWTDVLDGLNIDYEVRVYDDGSRDATFATIQAEAERNRRVIAARHANRGHGPTVMRGYLEATGEWVFQTDSDREMSASAFPELWQRRNEYDFLIGTRAQRQSPLTRRILTEGSRAVVALLFGRVVTDVNAPYRLMRGSWLRPLLPAISADAAVPNIILSGLASTTRARVLEIPVIHRERRSGTSSINVRRMINLSRRAVADAFRVARRMRR